MNPYFEKVVCHHSSFLAYERRAPGFPFDWHYHPEYELTLIIDSHGQRLVGDGIGDYGPGDLVLLGPNLPHSWRSGPIKSFPDKTHRAVVVQFLEDFLGPHFFKSETMEPVARLLHQSSSGLAFCYTEIGREVARYLARLPSLSQAKQLVTLMSALVDLSGVDNALLLSTMKVQPICRLGDQHRIDAICSYLNQHFADEIDFAKLTDRFHMEQASLCRFFKRATGRTITAYLNEIRVGAAAQLLTNSDDSVLDIAFRVGFGNYSNFSRQFKRIKGCAPRTLRQQFSPERHLSPA